MKRKHYVRQISRGEAGGRRGEGGGRGIADHWVERKSARRDPRARSFHGSPVFVGIDREREKRRAGREAFGLQSINTPQRLRRPDDPVGLHLRQTFLSTVADWGSLPSSSSSSPVLLSYRAHHPDSGLPRNNKRHIAWATIARVRA